MTVNFPPAFPETKKSQSAKRKETMDAPKPQTTRQQKANIMMLLWCGQNEDQS